MENRLIQSKFSDYFPWESNLYPYDLWQLLSLDLPHTLSLKYSCFV